MADVVGTMLNDAAEAAQREGRLHQELKELEAAYEREKRLRQTQDGQLADAALRERVLRQELRLAAASAYQNRRLRLELQLCTIQEDRICAIQYLMKNGIRTDMEYILLFERLLSMEMSRRGIEAPRESVDDISPSMRCCVYTQQHLYIFEYVKRNLWHAAMVLLHDHDLRGAFDALYAASCTQKDPILEQHRYQVFQDTLVAMAQSTGRLPRVCVHSGCFIWTEQHVDLILRAFQLSPCT